MRTLPNRDKTNRGRAAGALRRAALEAVEQRVLLSATLQYQPVDDAGNLGPPVTSQWVDGTSVQDYTPLQKSLLTEGFAAPKVDLFLQVAGIEGESTDPLHKGAIELESFSWGSDDQIGSATGGGGAGKVSYQDLHFTSQVSKASPKLLEDVATGTPIPQVDLFVRSKGNTPVEFLQIELENVLVSSYQLQSDGGGPTATGPTEEFSLNFAKVEFKYTQQNPDGSLASPVVFGSISPIEVQSFVPTETSLLDADNSPVAPSGNDFLKLEGVPGESTDPHHKDWIEVLSYSWGVSQTLPSGGGGAGQTNFQELHVTERLSSASPTIVSLLATGRHIPSAILTERRSATDPTDYYQIKLEDVLVSSYQLRTDASGPVEECTFSFGKVEVQYSPQKPDGTPDFPVVYDSGAAALTVQDHAPVQRSVIDAGVVDPQSVDFFLHVDGVEGASADPTYKDWIDVMSFSWGADEVRGLPGTGGVTSYDELHVVTRASTASAKLLADLSNGVPLPTSTLIARHNDGNQLQFLRFDLTGVLVSSYHTTTAADGTLLEEYTLNFGEVKEQYTPPPVVGAPNLPVIFDSGPGALVPAVKPPEPSLLTDNNGGVPLSASIDAFLEMDGIPGESADPVRKGWIEIDSFSWGATQSGSGSGGGEGKASFQDLHFTSQVSKASPLLMQALATGQHIPSAMLVVRKAGVNPVEFYEIRLEDVLVSSYQVRPGGFGGDHLAEEFTLNSATALETVHSTDGSTRDQTFQTPPTADVGRFAPVQQSLLQDGYQTMGAAVDAFLKVDGVDGESTNTDHKGWIEIQSWSWGATQAGTTSSGGGHGAGKVSFQDLHFVSDVSKATPELLTACCTGVHIPSAELSLVRSGNPPLQFLSITLQDVFVSSYQTVQAGDGSVLVEFTLSAAKATEQYTPQDSTDPPVSFTSPQGIFPDVFAPPQASPLDLGRISSGPSALFLDVAGVDGGSTDEKHRGWIEIQSWSWGASQTPSSAGGAGRASFQDLHFVAKVGKASPILIDRLVGGKHIPDAVLTVRKAGGTQPDYLKISLQDVLVSSYQLTTAPDGTPLEEFTLHFSEFTPPTLVSTTIGDGTAQRSSVQSVSFSFDRPVAMGDGSVRLELLNSGGSGKNDNSPPTDISSVLAAPTSADGGKTWVFTFVAGSPFVQEGSLADGIYTVSVDPTKVTANGTPMTAAPASVTFHRLLSDIDGDNFVGPGDFNILATHFGQTGQTASTGDLTGDGVVGPGDFNLLATRFGTRLIMPPVSVLSPVPSTVAAITQSQPGKPKVATPAAPRITARPRGGTIVKHR